jgi:Mg/Co/Ni transporter MgtE
VAAWCLVLQKMQAALHLGVMLMLHYAVCSASNASTQDQSCAYAQVIRGLATGSLDDSFGSIRKCMLKQVYVGLLLGGALSAGGFLRVYLTNGDLTNATAISLSLLTIVMTSVLLGTGLPFALSKLGVDPANAGTSIQVVMDVSGVGITCLTCDYIFKHLSLSLLQ